MATNSAIEWTETTWNPIAGCTPISPGCLHCYAAPLARRLAAMGQEKYKGTASFKGKWTGKINAADDFTEPLRWRKPRRVFVNSMSDLFHEDLPAPIIDDIFAVMLLCERHTFQVLTKRIDRAAAYLAHSDRLRAVSARVAEYVGDAGKRVVAVGVRQWPLRNVWIGTSIENQRCADERLEPLGKIHDRGWHTWVSFEPLLEEVRFFERGQTNGRAWHRGVGWAVTGGESGPGARGYNLTWPRSILAQCRAIGAPFYHKQCGSQPFLHAQTSVHEERPGYLLHVEQAQWKEAYHFRDPKGGDPAEWPKDLRVREYPKDMGP